LTVLTESLERYLFGRCSSSIGNILIFLGISEDHETRRTKSRDDLAKLGTNANGDG